MKKAVVLVKVEPGKEEGVFEKLKTKEFAKDVKLVFGDYDIVLTMYYEREADLEDLILEEIGGIEGVKSTTTLIVAKET